jgi:translation initiation factor IF-3
MSSKEAYFKAQDLGLDLLEISPNTTPPVCKIMDYGKYKYEEQKRKAEARKNQKVVETKELKFSPNIEEHDFAFKFKAAKKFLEEGCKVKFSMRFRGREVQSNQVGGKAVFERILTELGSTVKVEAEPKMESANQMFMLLSKAQ